MRYWPNSFVIIAALAISASPCYSYFSTQQFGFISTGIPHSLRQPVSINRRASVPPRHSTLGLQSARCQIKFADAVAELIDRQFDGKKVKRVIESWRKMDEDYVHRERVEEFDTWQEANSYIAGLEVKAFHDPYEFSWARSLRENAKIIQDEFRKVAVEGADELEEKGNNVWATAANATSASSYGPDWKTLALMDRCVWDEVNTKLFPETTRLLKQLEVPSSTTSLHAYANSYSSCL
jgi:hypothetical protein